MTTAARHILHNTLWSLAGTVVPMLAALAGVPWLLHSLGAERLGVLSLVWVVVGYFSFLDMGLGRAVTVEVARLRAQPNPDHGSEWAVMGTACALLGALGTLAALGLALGVWTFGLPVKLSSADVQAEVSQALLWTWPSLPLLLLTSALRGHLEAVGAFRALNLLRVPTGVALVLGPCLTASFSPSLVWACISILLVRSVHAGVLWALVARQLRQPPWALLGRLPQALQPLWLRRLLGFGSWVTLSNVIGPLIVYVDRFVIGAVLGATAVSAYAVPFDVVSRLPVLVAALGSVLLPELTRLSAQAAAGHAQALVRRASQISAGVMIGVVALAALLTRPALTLWLGADFAAQSTQLTQILLLAFGVNALAQIPFTALQAVGRVRQIALLHAAEVLPYAVLVWLALRAGGLDGAAWAWLARAIVDYAVLSGLWRAAARQPSPSA
ncbi:MAG: oligosaccharide flippase family protein [Rhodoferax sp.]